MIDVGVIGAGPAGLAAAHESSRHGAEVLVWEKLNQVGGLSRTTVRDGFRWDIGPHRFFTKSEEVRQLWLETLGDELLSVPRLTRIRYGNRFFDYPLKPAGALRGLGLTACAAIAASYVGARLRQMASPVRPRNFEEWVTLAFGSRLYETFFKGYTEKVWGIPCTRIGADWAAQRIKGLSLWTAAVNALFGPRRGQIKTLADEFVYPRLGAGMMYERMAQRTQERRARVLLGCEVTEVRRERDVVRSVVAEKRNGEGVEYEIGRLLSSAPLPELVQRIRPRAPEEVLAAAHRLRYRAHLAVNLEVVGKPFPDNWIYVHSRDVRLARVADYGNFSDRMAQRADRTPLTAEYFGFPGDDIWRRSDAELVALAEAELVRMGVLEREQVRSGFVVRSRQAYPVLEMGHQAPLSLVKRWLGTIRNLQTIGRGGMFKYNNQDHSIATGLLAARTALGVGQYDPWVVNIDAEYHEAGEAG